MDNPEGNNGPSSTNDSALFNLQGIINLEQFSLLFAQLLEQVESQNQKITKLETQVAQCLRINDFFAEVQKIDTYLNKLDKITQQLEIQSTSTIPGPDGELKKFAAGEVAQANFYQIQSLEKQLKLYTTHDEYEEQMRKIEQLFLNGRKYEYNINQLHEFITLLQKQMIEQNDTLSIHESLINNKLDKSEFSNLQSLMKIILIYEEFRNNTIKQLNDLEENHSQHHQKLVLQEEELKKCEKRVYTIEEQIPKFALKKDIHILAKELKVHSERLDECTLITQTEKLIEQIYTINEALRNTQIFINDLSNDVNTIQDILPTKATIAQFDLCLLKGDYEEFKSSMHESLSEKATLLQIDAIDGQLQSIHQRLIEDDKKIEIAIRFIDWWTDRGKLYEHNMKIIDRHLEDLVSSKKIPRVHTVHFPENQLRFEPVDPLNDDRTSDDEYDVPVVDLAEL